MGDGSDYADLERFERSPEGRLFLETFRDSLLGRTVTGVEFRNMGHEIQVTIQIGGAMTLMASLECLTLPAIWVAFGDVLQREYEADFPERRRVEYDTGLDSN